MKLTKPEYRKEAVYCLNELLTDAIFTDTKMYDIFVKIKDGRNITMHLTGHGKYVPNYI